MAKTPTDPGAEAPAGQIFDFLKGLTDEQAAAWVNKHWKDLEPDNASTLRELLQTEQAAATTARPADGSTMAPRTYDKVISAIDDNVDKDKATEQAKKQREKAVEQASTDLQAQGVDKATADQAAEDQIAVALGESLPVPDLIKQYTGGLRPTDQQQKDLVDVWNEFHPDETVPSYDAFVKIVQNRQSDPLAKQVVDAAFTGQDPVTVYEYSYNNANPLNLGERDELKLRNTTATTSSLRVSEAQFQAMKDIYGNGFGRRDVQKLGYLANELGIDQVVGGQPGWQILAAGAAAMGMWNLGDREQQPLKDTTSRQGSITNAKIAEQNSLSAKEVTKLRNWAVQFKTGMQSFGYNDSLAYVYAFDAGLAARVSTTKFDKLSTIDKRKAYSYMMAGGFSSENLAKLGYGWAAGLDELGVNQAASTAGDGIATRTMPDPDQLKQAAKDMYITLFRADPSDGELSRIVGAVTSAVAGADNDTSDNSVQDVNVQAQLRKQLEANPQYKELYGKKPGGLTEEEYARQFDAGAASILGNVAADPNIIRSGMRDGQYQTTVGAAIGSKEAQNNSTWLGRLATAAQLVSENT